MFGRLSDLNICSVHQGKYVWLHLSVPNWTHKRSEQEAENHLYVSGGASGQEGGGVGLGRSKGEQTSNGEVNHRTGDLGGRDATSTL